MGYIRLKDGTLPAYQDTKQRKHYRRSHVDEYHLNHDARNLFPTHRWQPVVWDVASK